MQHKNSKYGDGRPCGPLFINKSIYSASGTTRHSLSANGTLSAQYCAKRLIIFFIVAANGRRRWRGAASSQTIFRYYYTIAGYRSTWNDFHSRLVGALGEPSRAAAHSRYGLVFGPIRPGHQPPDQLRCMARRRRRRYPSAARTANGQRWVQAQADQSVEIALWTSSHAGKTFVSYSSFSTKCVIPRWLFICTSWNGGSEKGTAKPYTRLASKIRGGWPDCLLMTWSPVWSL